MACVVVVLFYGVRWIVNFNECEISHKWTYREPPGLTPECSMLPLLRHFGKIRNFPMWYLFTNAVGSWNIKDYVDLHVQIIVHKISLHANLQKSTKTSQKGILAFTWSQNFGGIILASDPGQSSCELQWPLLKHVKGPRKHYISWAFLVEDRGDKVKHSWG